MQTLLSDKVIIVTGGGGGIGRATCLSLAAAGARLVVTDIATQSGEDVTHEVVKAGGRAIFANADLQSEDDVRKLVETTMHEFGRLDGAFNNAGVEGHGKSVADLTLEEWNRVLNVDLTGVFLCLKYQIPAMIEGGGGTIVNSSSATALRSIPFNSEYISAKAGIFGLSKAAAIDYGRSRIRVNAIAPGLIATPMSMRLASDPTQAERIKKIKEIIPLGRLGEAGEIAETVKFLLSDLSSYITGTMIAVDGGYSS